MLLAASVVFTYYTAWAMLLVCVPNQLILQSSQYGMQPFFDSSSPIHEWFPAREWAVRVPAFILIIGLSVIGAFFGSTIAADNRKKAQQARARTA